ncbi:MAG: lysozyme [Rhizobiaceae bacterium]
MATMKVSKNGLMEIISHEGIVQTRYKDSVGVWTIGVGHTKAAGPPDPSKFTGTMTIKEVFALFEKDIVRFARDVNTVLKVDVSQSEFDALVSFHFNTGGIKKASLVKSLNAGNRPKAAKEFMNWKKPPEIIGRRRKEQKLFSDGTYSGKGKATVFPADAKGKVDFGKGKVIDLESQV